MSAGKYGNGHPFKDLLPIEGAFVTGFLYAMPPQFVKVYLFLIYLCNHTELKFNTLKDIADKLGLTVADTEASFAYLSEKHLINYTARPFAFELLSAEAASNMQNMYSSGALTAYADYFAGIRALFPGRSISAAEYDKAQDWVELYGLSVETALLLISHCIEQKDAAIGFSYIDRVALSWANEGITSAEAAEEYLSLYHAKRHDAAKLLQHLGLNRTPTYDEIKLYRHWTNDLGFDIKAIKASCSETTKTTTPSFAYIGRILERLHESGLTNEKQIRAYLSEENSDRRLAAVVLAELGERSRTVTVSHTEPLKEYVHSGIKPEKLIEIARLMCENGMHTFTKYLQKLEEIKQQDAFDEPGKLITRQTQQKQADTKGFKGRNDGYGNDIFSNPDPNDI